MEKKRKQQFIIITALMASLICLSVGFAAFSTVLNISTQAAVSPNEKEFKVMIYGFDTREQYFAYQEDPLANSSYLNPNSAFAGTSDSNTLAENLSINNTTHSIVIPEITYIDDYTSASYPLIVKNEGKYDAYLDTTGFTTETGKISRFYYGTCTAEPNTQQTLVDKACVDVVNKIRFDVKAENEYNQLEQYYKIPPGGESTLVITIGVATMSEPADGPFKVAFPDIKLNFSTTK